MLQVGGYHTHPLFQRTNQTPQASTGAAAIISVPEESLYKVRKRVNEDFLICLDKDTIVVLNFSVLLKQLNNLNVRAILRYDYNKIWEIQI